MNPIFHRVSIRKYKDQSVEKDKILQILKAGMQAPSACNQQPWEFYVVTDTAKIKQLSQCTPYAKCVAEAPVVIVPVYRTEGLPALQMVPIDMGICLENMWLETDELGLGGVCIGVSPIQEFMEAVHQVLGIPKGLEVFSLFALGYPDEEKVQQDRFDQKRIHIIE